MKINKILLVALMCFTLNVQADRLDDIKKQGYITIGTTGDYKPFTYYDGKQYSGYDIDVAKYFAKELGVKIHYVKTSWKNLISDLKENKYDIAMGGITRRISRQLTSEQTQGYMTFGKVFLSSKGKESFYDTLEKVNRPEIRVGVNIGGTNEKFALKNLSNASIIKFENNLDVPIAVVNGKVDIMVTETPEALYYQATNKNLQAVREEDPFTKSQFGYLIPSGEQRLLNTINFLMDEMKLKGIDKVIMKKNSLL